MGGGADVTVCLEDEQVTQHCKVLDTDAFDIVIGTDFLQRNLQVKHLSLQRPYALHCDFGSGLFSVPLDLSGQKECGLLYVNWSYRTANYHFVQAGLENGLAVVLTKIALETARLVLCTPDWGTTGEHAYWMRWLDCMTLGMTEPPNGGIYVPENSQETMQAAESGSCWSIMDGFLNPVPASDVDQVVLKELMVEK